MNYEFYTDENGFSHLCEEGGRTIATDRDSASGVESLESIVDKLNAYQPKLKPLEWKTGTDTTVSFTCFGIYTVEPDGEGGFEWTFTADSVRNVYDCTSIEDGKAKAWSDYQRERVKKMFI